MDGLLRKIYEDIISYEDDAISINRAVEGEVLDIMEPYLKKLDGDEKENFQGCVFDAVSAAEREAFYLGMRYAWKFLFAVMG